MYYVVVKSLSELLGEEGILRLPSYLPDVFVFDDARRRAVSDAVDYLVHGDNVLIEGSPGTGKTALMFMVLRELSSRFGIGYIVEGVTSIGNEHFDRRVVLFYDDLPRMNPDALRSIVKNMVRGIIATARSEEVVLIKRVLGIDLYEYFRPVRLPPLSDEKIREILLRYLDVEVVKVLEDEAVDEVVKKAGGLPVYVWQVVRELKIRRESLTLSFAKSIPQGMLDYVDDILWRLLGGKPERYEVILTLLCMTDFARYAVHQDLFTYIYLVAKERRIKKRLSLEDIVMDVVIEDIARYLAREGASYAFRLPHDSWADVLRGKSNGPMASEIAKLNALYTHEKRNNIVLLAARRAWWETLRSTTDMFRREAFKSNVSVNLGDAALKDILEKPPRFEEKPAVKVVVEKPTTVEVRIEEGDPIDILRGHLAKARVISKSMLSKRMNISIEELDNLLDIADFDIASARPGFIIYKDHYFSALKRAEELLSKMGMMNARNLSESVGLFTEDIARGLGDKVIVYSDVFFYREFLWKVIKGEIGSNGYVDLSRVSEEKKIPLDVLMKLGPDLGKQYVRSANPHVYYDKEYYSAAVRRAIQILGEKHVVNVGELSNRVGLLEFDIGNALSGYAIVYRGRVFYREYVWKTLMRELNTRNRICLGKLSVGIPYEVLSQFKSHLEKVAIISPSGECFYTRKYVETTLVEIIRGELESKNIVRVGELSEKLDVQRKHVREVLDIIAMRSPTDEDLYYRKDFVENIVNTLVDTAISLNDISRKHGMPLDDIKIFLRNRGLEKEYFVARLRKILEGGLDYPSTLRDNEDEIQMLIDTLSRQDLNPDEINIIGVAYLVLWEISGNRAYFEKGVEKLKNIDTRKARKNLAIAYAKYSAKLLNTGAEFKEVKKYALIAKSYAKGS